MKIYLTAIIETQPEFLAEVKSVLENMVVETRKESACLQYDLHQSIENENTFIFYEIWANQSGLDEHNKQPYIQEFIELGNKLASSPSIYLSKKL
jgi:quinol monooxygenase YgiN